ncbi:hypothetical protein EVAR_8465_1 [Eumeta japonica]|uniref:Uncharacterized protein n=1 Tax=Eumeta variegata TaxID=151549 RepID=A0A4C1WBT8_EUMVA|nr:hypothetical protein EVAR_8465_1 [Eumeta japonica]
MTTQVAGGGGDARAHVGVARHRLPPTAPRLASRSADCCAMCICITMLRRRRIGQISIPSTSYATRLVTRGHTSFNEPLCSKETCLLTE